MPAFSAINPPRERAPDSGPHADGLRRRKSSISSAAAFPNCFWATCPGRHDANLLRFLLKEFPGGNLFDPARKAGMPVVEFIVPLPAGQLHLSGIDHDHKVPGVDVGREGGLGLAPQHHGNAACLLYTSDAADD